jgi:hypothetical protein
LSVVTDLVVASATFARSPPGLPRWLRHPRLCPRQQAAHGGSSSHSYALARAASASGGTAASKRFRGSGYARLVLARYCEIVVGIEHVPAISVPR